MFGMGWSEMVVIGIVALIVVGPQELPGLFRTVGQYVGKAKGMAREFSRAMDQAADQAGVKEIKQGLNAASNPTKFAKDSVKKQVMGDAETLTPERQATKEKLSDAMAQAAIKRQEAEAAAQQTATEAEADAEWAELEKEMGHAPAEKTEASK